METVGYQVLIIERKGRDKRNTLGKSRVQKGADVVNE